MVRDIFRIPLARELSELLYENLKEKQNGELNLNEILVIFDSKSEYGLARVNGGAIHLIKEKRM